MENMINIPKSVDTSIDIVSSEENDCCIVVEMSYQGQTMITNKHDLSFSEAKEFIKELQCQIDVIEKNNN